MRYLGAKFGLGLGGVLFLALGLLLLLFSAAELLVPRARFMNSRPAPSVTVAAPPPSVRITFDQELHPTSGVLVRRSDSGNVSRVDVGWRLDPDDAGRRTLIVSLQPELSDGLYRVEWHARTRALYFTPWGTEGNFYFGVGVPVPAHLTARQWDEGSLTPETGVDARLYQLFAAVVFVVVGLAWPWVRQSLKSGVGGG